MQDSQFLKIFFGMLGALVLLTILLMVIAVITGGGVSKKLAAERVEVINEQVAERIQPEGVLKVGLQQASVAAAGAAETADATEVGGGGEQVYASSCSACHASGVAGAPMLTDSEAWAPRLEQGQETLVRHAIEGLNAMPPKGGNMSLSDDQVTAAVDYMTEQVQQ